MRTGHHSRCSVENRSGNGAEEALHILQVLLELAHSFEFHRREVRRNQEVIGHDRKIGTTIHRLVPVCARNTFFQVGDDRFGSAESLFECVLAGCSCGCRSPHGKQFLGSKYCSDRQDELDRVIYDPGAVLTFQEWIVHV